MPERTAAVIGGGIGGLAAAVALRRIGWSVTIFERAPEFTEVGAGLSLWPNGMRALERLGLAAHVREVGVVEQEAGIRDRRGRWLSRTRSVDLERRYGHPLVVVHRTELVRVLVSTLPVEALRAGTEVHDVPEADLLVAADGMRSAIRARHWPGYEPRYAGHTAWRMVTNRVQLDSSGGVTWGRGERFGYTALPAGRVYCFGTATVPEGGASADGEYAELLRRFGTWPDPIPALLEATAPESVLRHDLYDLPRLPSFVSGRTALLGDAAHAMTPSLGQGACQALEDAVTLAECVSRAPDVAAALAAYDRLRRPRTQDVVRRSAVLSAVGQLSSPPAAVLRDLAARIAPEAVMVRAMDRVLRWHM